MTAGVRVALVEDDDDLRASTAQLLRLAGHSVDEHADAFAAHTALGRDYDGVVITDIRMPGMSGIELFRLLHERDPELPVILITGHADVDTAVTALQGGAWDFLVKPTAPEALLASVARAAKARQLVVENRRLRAAAEAQGADELVGDSEAMRRLRATVPQIAATDLDLVIKGATGTGKHLLARLIHRAGKRARHRMITFDCAAPPNASDPFGPHGVISQAHRGTLLLNRLDRAEAALQQQFVRFAERRAIALDRREPMAIDVRIIAMIDDGARDRLLPALYHRLAAVTLRLPSMTERLDDIALLVAHLLPRVARQHNRLEPSMAAAADIVARTDWPGNVRELEMAVERLVLGIDGDLSVGDQASLPERVRAFERAAIVEAMERTGGDVSQVVRTLGIPRETFYYRVKRLGLDLTQLRRQQECPR